MEREPIVKGGQGRTDAEVEQCGLVVGVVACIVVFVGPVIVALWLMLWAAGGMG